MNNQKFEIKSDQIVFRSTGEAIPEDEPVFVLRARDKGALSILRVYQSTMRPVSDNFKGVQRVMDDFTVFREIHPDRMLPPDEAYTSKPNEEANESITH